MAVDYTPSFDPADVDSDYGSTGGDITVPTFTANMKPFRFWCQQALPLVYDDSLSYYEVLCKVVDQLNGFLTDLQTATGSIAEFAQQFVVNQQFLNDMAAKLGQDVDTLETYINDRMDDFTAAYQQLQSYVNNYFDNLDVQQEINNKLDAMAQDGTLNTLFDPVLQTWMQQKTAQIDAAIANQDAIQAQQNGRISVLESRMDGFSSLPSGSTSGNAELLDIRTNFLGERYPSAGDAVRTSDMIASGFQSIGFTRLTDWNGNAESSVYDTIVFDVAAYKGGHVVVIANMDNFVSDIEAAGGIGLFGSNIAGKTVDSNAEQYPFPDGYSGLSDPVFKNYYIIPTSITGEERVLLQLSIPTDFAFQYLKLGNVEFLQGTYTTPAAIVYATSWSKTPVDATLSIAGNAADAKATGDAVSSLTDLIDNLGAYGTGNNLLNTDDMVSGLLNTTGDVVANASFKTTAFIPVNGIQSIVFQAEQSGIPTTTDTLYFFEYDSTKTKIGTRQSFTIARGNKSATFSTNNASTAYIRLSYVVARYTDVMIHSGSEVIEYEPYYILKSEIAKSSDVAALANQLEEYAKLPNTYTPIETTVEQGNIRTNLELYNPSESYAGRYTSISVSEGDVYAISGYSVNNYYPCAFVRTATTVQTLLDGTSAAYVDEVITIPAGFNTLYVNGNVDYQVPIIKTQSRITQSEFEELITNVSESSNAQYPLKCLYKNGIFYVKKKYDATKDLIISFGNVGGNSLFNFNSAFLLSNSEADPSNDFTGANAIASWSMSGSDWLGPYKVSAVNNADGDTPENEYFTGGNHRTTNTGSGGGVTATQQNISILVNGSLPIVENIIYPCDCVTVVWSNNVQAYNTSKADGTGRAVLNETWYMSISKNCIKLHNTIKALEDIDIKTYYGLQATNISGKKYRYVGGNTRAEKNGSETGNSGNNTCRDLKVWDNNFNLTITVDPVDLGLFNHNLGYSFFAASSKLYSYLIGQTMRVGTGDYLDLVGSYSFM